MLILFVLSGMLPEMKSAGQASVPHLFCPSVPSNVPNVEIGLNILKSASE